MSSNNEVVLWPIGKYKGAALEEVLRDESYIKWILANVWFPEQYPEIHKLIVKGGAEPQDSPEHNEFQARFLDDELCLAVAATVLPKLFIHPDAFFPTQLANARKVEERIPGSLEYVVTPPKVTPAEFEVSGWDVVIKATPGSAHVNVTVENPEEVATAAAKHPIFLDWCGVKEAISAPNFIVTRQHPLLPPVQGSHVLQIELKPDLGDDYPSVLRQMKKQTSRSDEPGRSILLVRRARFSTVSFETVGEFFKRSGVTLLLESDITPAAYELARSSIDALANWKPEPVTPRSSKLGLADLDQPVPGRTPPMRYYASTMRKVEPASPRTSGNLLKLETDDEDVTFDPFND